MPTSLTKTFGMRMTILLGKQRLFFSLIRSRQPGRHINKPGVLFCSGPHTSLPGISLALRSHDTPPAHTWPETEVISLWVRGGVICELSCVRGKELMGISTSGCEAWEVRFLRVAWWGCYLTLICTGRIALYEKTVNKKDRVSALLSTLKTKHLACTVVQKEIWTDFRKHDWKTIKKTQKLRTV